MNTAIDNLYVHVPFCLSKCDYCAFHSTDGVDESLLEAYLNRMQKELSERAVNCTPLRTVFIGGGTPSALPHASLARLLNMIQDHFDFEAGYEFTVECNPSSLDADKLKIMRDTGVNRLSLGVQSFNDSLRAVIGRRGELVAVKQGLDMAVSAFENVNCDLIFGIPGQTTYMWTMDLTAIAERGVKHISAYALTIEESTPLARRNTCPIDEDGFIRFWEQTTEVLAGYGFARYEISNFAKPGYQCSHNDRIWHGRPYAAAGPAAHGYDGTTRYANPPLKQWLAGENAVTDDISKEERAVEVFIMGLRTLRGWELADLHKVVGVDVMSLRSAEINALSRAGLLQVDEASIRPTPKGLLLNDWIGSELI